MVSSRHIRRGTMRLIFAADIADPAAPTVAELNAGTDLSGDVASLDGFELARDPAIIETADGYGTVLSVLGVPSVPAPPRLTLYDEGDGNASLRTLLAEGAQGFVAICLDGTPQIGGRVAVWPVVSCGTRDSIAAEPVAATFSVTFAVWAMPVEAGEIS